MQLSVDDTGRKFNSPKRTERSVIFMKESIYIGIFSATGEKIDTKKRTNKGPHKGECGQYYKGESHGYTYGVGIYTMHYNAALDRMEIDTIVMTMDQIRQKTRNYFRKKRFMFVCNDETTIYFYEFLASRNTELILMCASLNTNSRCGLCFRAVNGYAEKLALCAGIFKTVSIPDFIQQYRAMQEKVDTNFNIGNFCEYLLSGKLSDIDNSRFSDKKQDFFFHGYRYELKSSLSIPELKDKSKSNTNLFCTLD